MSQINYSPSTPVLVTGGASGMGRACAEVLTEAGRPVVIWDLDADKAASVAASIEEKNGVKVVGLAVDVSDLDQIEKGLQQSREHIGRFGGVAHCAGVPGIVPLEQMTAESWVHTMDINLRSWPFIIKGMIEDFKVTPGAAAVAIASTTATVGVGMIPTYSASKAGILGINRSMADDLSRYGIRINAVSPGHILTPMLQVGMDMDPTYQERVEKFLFAGRLGQAREIATAVRFLLSDDASYITAQELIVDGGATVSHRF